MSFKTKIDLSNNRFFKQEIDSVSNFKGINHFSTPLNERHLGPNLEKISTELVDSNLHIDFIYDKTSNKYEFKTENELFKLNENQIVTQEISPYSEDIFSTIPNYIGINPYYIENELFFENYIGYSYDFSIELVSENTEKILGYLIINEIIKYTAESRDYNGENDVIYAYGNIKADLIKPLKTYEIKKIENNIVMNEIANILYLYENGLIEINPENKIGWNAYIYGENLEFDDDIELIKIPNTTNFFEIIKIDDNKYLLK